MDCMICGLASLTKQVSLDGEEVTKPYVCPTCKHNYKKFDIYYDDSKYMIVPTINKQRIVQALKDQLVNEEARLGDITHELTIKTRKDK